MSGDTQAKKPRLTLKIKAAPAASSGGGGPCASVGTAAGGDWLGGSGAASASIGAGGGAAPYAPPTYAPPSYAPPPAVVPKLEPGAVLRPAAVAGGAPARPAGQAGAKPKMLVKIKPLALKRPGAAPAAPLHLARSAAPSAMAPYAIAPNRVRPLARPAPPPAAVHRPPPAGPAVPGGATGAPVVVAAAGAKRSSSGVMEIQPARAAKRPRVAGARGSDGEGGDDDDYVPPKRAPPPGFLARHGSLPHQPSLVHKKKMLVKGGRLVHAHPGAARPAAPAPAGAVAPAPRRGVKECPPTGENLFKVWDAVAKKDQFQFFAYPVDLDKYPNYKEVVARPMDLSTIKIRMDGARYATYEALLEDMDLMFDNAIKFNPKEHIIHELAIMMKDIAHTAADMVRQGKTLRGALAAKTRMLNSRLASHRAVIQAEQKAADKAARRAAGEPVSESEPDSPIIERQERERQERDRQDRQLQRAERLHSMMRGRGRGRGRRGRGRGRGGGHGAIYEEDPHSRRARQAAAAPKEADFRADDNAMLSFGQKVRAGRAGGLLGLMAPWGGLANGASAEGSAFGWGRPIVGAVQGPASTMPPGAYASSLARFAAGAGARVQALVASLLGPQLRQLEPAAALQHVKRAAAQKAAAAAAAVAAEQKPVAAGGGG